MNAPATPEIPVPQRLSWQQRLFTPALFKMLLAAAALGAATAGAAWWAWLRPARDAAAMRAATVDDVLALYGLEMRYAKAKGSYASDLDTLLTLTPDGAQRKARMAGHLDLSTLAIVGDARKFKIEANALDAERTLVKIKGPIADRPAPRTEVLLQDTGTGLGSDGKPLAPAPAPRGR